MSEEPIGKRPAFMKPASGPCLPDSGVAGEVFVRTGSDEPETWVRDGGGWVLIGRTAGRRLPPRPPTPLGWNLPEQPTHEDWLVIADYWADAGNAEHEQQSREYARALQ